MFAPLFGLASIDWPPDALLLLVRFQVWLARPVLVTKCSASITTWPPLSRKAPLVLHDPLLGCVHVPPLHTSFVHVLPSSAHGLVLFACVHAPPLHTSFVHVFPSSVHGFVLFACAHTPALQASLVHALPSSVHTVPSATGACWQPSVGLQLSVVHSLVSAQFTGACWQPVAGLHESVVHASLSLQLGGVPV